MRPGLTAFLVFGLGASGAVAACGGAGDDGPPVEVADPVPLVDPRIGAGGLGFAYGSAFVGACVPNGLVKVGPDTDGPFGTVSFQHYSGYWAGDDKVQAFTHLHLHGAGLADYGVVGIMPTTAWDPSKTAIADYEARFTNEVARPGWYSLELDGGIAVDVTATAHTAAERYTFASGPQWIVIDPQKHLGGDVMNASLAVDEANHRITGELHHAGGMSGNYGGYDLYFAIEFSGAWMALDQTQPLLYGVEFPAGAPVELHVGVSLVSAAGALANLDAELPATSWDFAATAAAAQQAWRDRLGVVKLTGGTDAEQRTFYTSLYHAFLMPSEISDADGSYRLVGVADPLTIPAGRMLSDLSLWDTYRTANPLYDWLAPDAARDVVGSLVAFGSGLGAFPRWPIAIGESGTMLGASAEVVIGDAVAKGVVDASTVDYPRMRAEAMDAVAPPGGRGGRGGVESYLMYGYVPSTDGRSVSATTEFAHDDFALATIARAVGEDADADALMARRLGWRMLFDPSVGFLRGRAIDGSFPAGDFDPTDQTDEYAEADAWQSLWMAGAHDPDGLAGLFGGPAGAVDKLTEMFTLTRTDWEQSDPSAANFPRKYYWHGNEPDLDAPFLFAQLGRPDLAQEWTRWVMTTHYSDQPDGVAGNDDGGTLGSWYVFAALGLYPIPGSDRYVVTGPLFPRARIVVDGHELVIDAPAASAETPYVRSITIDGVPLATPEITHAQLLAAHTIAFEMAASP